jgi:streptogramin lyase
MGSWPFPHRARRQTGFLAAAAALLVPLSALCQTPTVARVVPAFGSYAGNNVVIVSGSGFAAGATVTFGGVPATSVTVVNANSLTAKPPTHGVGPVTVSVTNPNSQVGSLSNGYKYLMASGTFSISYLPVTVPDTFVTNVAAGPDGNLWFLTNGGESSNPDGLGKMTTSGTFTAYPLTDEGLLVSIAPGPDGNVWYLRHRGFGESILDRIGKVTPSGVATEFPNTTGSNFESLAAGPDGAMWITENFVNLVGRMTTAGSFTEFIVDNHAHGITLGPDGNLWLAGCVGPGAT